MLKTPDKFSWLHVFLLILPALVVTIPYQIKTLQDVLVAASSDIRTFAEQINGCSDQYMDIDVPLHLEKLDIISDQVPMVNALALIIIICQMIAILSVVVYTIACKCFPYELDKETAHLYR